MELHRKRLYFIIAGMVLIMLFLVVGLISVINPGVNDPGSPGARTEIPLGANATPVPVNTPTAHATPGIVVFGYVHNESSIGMQGVEIYRQYASYPGVVVATTGPDGYYQSDFSFIPGDEMVTIYAALPGTEFQPEQCYWRHYYGHERTRCDFQVFPADQLFLPLIGK